MNTIDCNVEVIIEGLLVARSVKEREEREEGERERRSFRGFAGTLVPDVRA